MQYDLEYVFQKSIKGQALVDQLADFPQYEEIRTNDEFPDEHVLRLEIVLIWKIYFDGSRNVMGADIGILLITPEDEMILYSLKLDFSCTHNVVEYEALIQGLRSLLSFQVKMVHAFGDS
uniref:Uncharacterized protein n=1 Tax=Nymphaea colorata TaxID=210225 RepID=A0A5K1EIT5_9MAGN